jgi:hypothetical protein
MEAFHREGRIHVIMESGLEIAFQIAGNKRLTGMDHDSLNRIVVSPFGLHWPDLDEDLSIEEILAGRYGKQNTSQALNIDA